MAEQDEFIRLSLRLPIDIHEKLTSLAAGKRSLNAEIISRLEATLADGDLLSPQELSDSANEHEKRIQELERRMERLEELTLNLRY